MRAGVRGNKSLCEVKLSSPAQFEYSTCVSELPHPANRFFVKGCNHNTSGCLRGWGLHENGGKLYGKCVKLLHSKCNTRRLCDVTPVMLNCPDATPVMLLCNVTPIIMLLPHVTPVMSLFGMTPVMLVPDVTLVMSLCDVHTRHVIAQCDIHHCSMYVTWPPSTLTNICQVFA